MTSDEIRALGQTAELCCYPFNMQQDSKLLNGETNKNSGSLD